MNKYLSALCLIGLLFASGKVAAQSAIYVCEKTGKWGATGDNGEAPRATMKEVKDAALKMCKESGGEDCVLYYSSTKNGYFSFMGGNSRDEFVFALGISQQSERDAMKKSMDNYLKQGGIVRIGLESVSWHCPKDPVQKKKSTKN